MCTPVVVLLRIQIVKNNASRSYAETGCSKFGVVGDECMRFECQTYIMSFDETFSTLTASQHPPFKPCIGCNRWLLIQVNILVSLFQISLQTYSCQKGTRGVIISELRTSERCGCEDCMQAQTKLCRFQIYLVKTNMK